MQRGDVWAGSKELLHDVINALTTAQNYVQFLSHGLAACPGDAHHDGEALSAIETNVEHAIQLLKSARRTRQSAACDLIALAREAAASVPPGRIGDVVVRSSQALMPLGLWDPLTVSRILANLLDNAAKYSQPGTPIMVEMATDDAGVEIVVNDHGIGVPEGELEAIFAGHRSEAARAMASGQGLGLRTSRRLAEEMGGHLWAMREQAGGTAFHLWLPWPGPG